MKLSDKKIKIILSDEAEEMFVYLSELEDIPQNKKEISILNTFNKKKEIIKAKPGYEDSISKNKIPKKYKDKYGITNLYRIELPNFWRALYTLKSGDSEIEVVAFVIDICDHKKYNKLFGYNKK